MKVECGACQAKYQIPDERVAGRKLKIRCRKCSGAIIVRGDQIGVTERVEQPHGGNAHPSGEWHVSLDGEQHGPYSGDQMAEMLRAAQLSWDAHVWRDGYPDWKTAGESDTLVRAVASAHDHDTPAAGIVDSGFDDDPTRMVQGSAPPSEGLRPVVRSAFADRAAHQQSQPPSGHAVPQQADFGYAGPQVSAARSMTGERHEDSVLFSARNLQARVQSSPPSQRPGYAEAEGSGLIDIRALAALARTNQAPARPVTNGAAAANGVYDDAYENDKAYENGRGRDEVMALAHQTGAFGRLDSLAPMEQPARASSNAVPIAIVTGAALVAAAAFLAVYLTRTPEASQPAVALTGQAEQPGIAAAAQPQAAANPVEAQAPEAEEAERAEEADEAEEPQAADEERAAVAEPASNSRPARARPRAAAKRGARTGNAAPRAQKAAESRPEPAKQSPAASAKETASIDDLLLSDAKPAKEKAAPSEAQPSETAAAPAKAAESARNRSIDDLLDGAVDGKGGKPKPEAAAAAAALPDSPSRDDVKAAMKAVEPDVKACGEGQELESPTATVAITVTGTTGRVTSVRVTGIQGTVGSCVARAVRGASFPKFAKPQFSINFPFRLK